MAGITGASERGPTLDSDLTTFRYTYAMLIAAEISAAATVIQYWTTAVPVAVWITILLVIVVFLNIFVVSIYGEAEFWFARSV